MKARVIDYMVVRGTPDVVQTAVAVFLSDGWELYGGLKVVNENFCVQAMILRRT